MRVSLTDWTAEIEAAKDKVFAAANFLESPREPRPNDPNSELIRIGNIHKPTKIPHNYLPRYAHVFDAIRHDVRVMVEIGVQTDVSVKTWKDYFPNAHIIGLDIDPECSKFAEDRVEILIGDQRDPSFLLDAIKHIGQPIDIVVDDGLHTPDAIMASFKYLYPALSSYGIYAIEDVIAIPEINAFFMDTISAIQHWPRDVPGALWPILREFEDHPGWFVQNTIGIEVYRYIGFVKRGFNPLTNPNFMTDDECFVIHNRSLDGVKAAVAELQAKGIEPTRALLEQAVGFQERHAVAWYLAGMTQASWENWRALRTRQLEKAPMTPPKTTVERLEREVASLKAEIAKLQGSPSAKVKSAG
jgi:hypothetical protein